MDHNWNMLLAIGSRVGKFKALREIEIYLNGSELPLPSQDIFYHEVDFRTVESRLAKFLREWYP